MKRANVGNRENANIYGAKLRNTNQRSTVSKSRQRNRTMRKTSAYINLLLFFPEAPEKENSRSGDFDPLECVQERHYKQG